MRVLFISSWYPATVNPLKGLFVKRHAQAIHKAGIDITVLALTVNPSQKLFQKLVSHTTDEAGMVIHSIELNSRFYKLIHLALFFQNRILQRYYRKHIKPHFKPDLVHSNVLYPAAILGFFTARREKVPHIITEHWSKVDKFMETSLYSNLGKQTYHFAASITVVSGYLKKRLARHVSNSAKIEVIPNVIDTTIFFYRPKPSRDKLVFTCVAQWGPPKRPDLIFDALDYVSRQISKPIELNVVGEGPLLVPLRDKKRNFGINYKGNLNASELADTLRGSDYFLHASDIETFSIVIAEALATGTPVLASNTGAIPELVNSSNGISTYNTTEDWARSLFELIDRKDFDHKQIAEEAKRFDEKQIGEAFKSVYKRIL